MDINERSTTPKIGSPEEAFLKLSIFSFHYHHTFSKEQRRVMRLAFRDNIIGQIVKSGEVKYNRIGSFDSYRDYFLYQITDRQLQFIHKSDINFILKQVKHVVLEGFRVYKHLRN